MSEKGKTSPETVPGLGFKDKDTAVTTLKNLEGRDPDYQKLAIKGLIGRAKRTLTLTKAEDKIQNIKSALEVFEEWLKDFEKLNLGKENRPYLPLASIQTLLALKKQYNIEDEKAEAFIEAYKSVGGDYKHLRTVVSGEDEPTWDIVRNTVLKTLVESVEDQNPDLWDDDLPTKEHVELIIWGYSPDASRIKKSLPKLEEKLGKPENGAEKEKEGKRSKRRSDSTSSSSGSDGEDDESPKKKSKN